MSGTGPATLSRVRSDVQHGSDLNPTVAALLGLLRTGTMTGWDLVGEAEARIGAVWPLTRSQVYRELGAMESAGLIRAGAVGGRERKPYTITERGEALFAQWLATDPGHEQIRVPLLLTLAFADHLPAGRARELLDRSRVEHEARLRRLERREESDPFRRATQRFERHHERAMLAWLDEVRAEL